MKLNTEQIRLLADMAKTLSLGLVSGTVVDAVLDGTRLPLDGFGFLLGMAFGIVAVWLTGKLDESKIE